jgi:hypothetical protein
MDPLREQLRKILDWEDAHIGFDRAVEGVDPKLRGAVPTGLPAAKRAPSVARRKDLKVAMPFAL